MWKFIVVLIMFVSTGHAGADERCFRRYIQPNGVVAMDDRCETPNSIDPSRSSAKQKTPSQAGAEFFGGVGQRINLNFQNIEIRSLMQVFSEISGKRFSVDDAVRGSVNIAANNQPWTEAIVVMLFSKRLAIVPVRSGYYICLDSMTDEICRRRAAVAGF